MMRLFSLTLMFSLLLLLITTACSGSSAATQPPETNNGSAAPSSATGEQPGLAQAPSTSPEAPPVTAPAAEAPAATVMPSPTPSPTLPPPPTPTPTPSLRRLTSGGCCVQPFFSADGSQVLFIDKPGPEAPAGIYGVDLANPQPEPFLDSDVIGFYNSDRTIVASLDGSDLARFSNQTTGQSWTVNTGGNPPHFSPDSSRILWVASDREGPYDRRQSDIWLAGLDGSNARLLLSVRGGGFGGWFPDNQHILLISRDDPSQEEQTLFTYNVDDGSRTDLFTHKRLRGAEISSGGQWVAFFLTFADEDPSENGIWVISADGRRQEKLDVPGFGSYRWRDDNTLLYIPMRASAEESMQLWSVDIPTGQSHPLTDPASLSFSISNGDWDVSPDGQHVIFVNSADQNIWLITLP